MGQSGGHNQMKVTLRHAITEYSRWVAALWAASVRQTIYPDDTWIKLEQLKIGLRYWVGEDLLNKEL